MVLHEGIVINLPKPTEHDEPLKCPHCKTNLLAEPIPKDDLKHYGGSKYFKREIAFYDREQDRTVYHKCPDCKEKI